MAPSAPIRPSAYGFVTRPRRTIGRRNGEDFALRLKTLRNLLTAAAVCAATMALAEDKKPPAPMPAWQIQFPLDSTFSLRELNGKPVPAELDISLKIDGAARASGFDGCQTWSSIIYPAPGQKLAMAQQPAFSGKQCAKDLKALESGFLNALTGNPSWDLINDELIIKGPRGTLKMVRSL